MYQAAPRESSIGGRNYRITAETGGAPRTGEDDNVTREVRERVIVRRGGQGVRCTRRLER